MFFDYLNFSLHTKEVLIFFVLDSIKIIVLLIIINFFMAAVRYYLPVEKIRDFLASRNWFGFDYFLASLFGSITPFCTCSSIPIFVGFLEAGIPLGVTFAFLITSPLVNEVAIILFLSLFGLKITFLYIVAAMFLGIISGMILGKLKMENQVADYIWKIRSEKREIKFEKKPIIKLLKIFWVQGFALTKKIVPFLLLGVGLGAIIHGFVPAGFFEKYITPDNLFAVPLAVILAVPLYSNAVGVIPVVESLVAKGIPLGTALAFMMATVGLSLPEALILKKVIKNKLLIYFFGITALNMIIIGYLFNFFLS